MKIAASKVSDGKDASFQTAIEAAGHGKFQIRVFLTTGILYFHAGMQSAVNAYILPSVKCEYELSASQMGILNAAFLVGGMMSAHLWGALSDALGRRPVMISAVLLDAINTALSTFSPTWEVFAAFRMISGMLIAAPSGLSFLYMSEFFDSKHRSPFMLTLGCMWTLAWICIPGLAWLVIPQPWTVNILGTRFTSWRIFLSLLVVPALVAAGLVASIPETPKFLQSIGREDAALGVYRRIFATNTGASVDGYPVKRLSLPSTKAVEGSGVVRVLRTFGRTVTQSMELFKPPVLWRTLMCCAIYFSNMFSYYGLAYWMPELLNRFEHFAEEHPYERAGVCELMQPANITVEEEKPVCDIESAVNPSVFIHTVIISSVCLAVNLMSSVSSSKIGRRSMAALTNIASGLVGLGVYFSSTTLELVAVASVFEALIDTGCIAINGLIVDIFPPRIGAVGVACVMLSGRLGAALCNLVLGYLLEVSCDVPLFLICAVAVGCGLLCCFAHNKWDKSGADSEREPSGEDGPCTPAEVEAAEGGQDACACGGSGASPKTPPPPGTLSSRVPKFD